MTVKYRRRPAGESPFMGPNYVDNVSFTIGVQAGSVINVAMVLEDANSAPIPGNNTNGAAFATGMIGPGYVRMYLSDAADGSALIGTGITTVAIGTNGAILNAPVATKLIDVISTLAGLIDLNLTKNAARTIYLCVILPNGNVVVSPAIVFT